MLREIISRCKTIKYCADNFTQDFGLDCKKINNTIVNCSITLNNNTVTLTKGSTSQTILATGIQSITLNRHNTNNRMVQISITANNNNSSYTLQQAVVALNNNVIWQ